VRSERSVNKTEITKKFTRVSIILASSVNDKAPWMRIERLALEPRIDEY